jgi:hypothetical protein
VIVCYEEVIVSNIFMLKSTKGGGRNDP